MKKIILLVILLASSRGFTAESTPTSQELAVKSRDDVDNSVVIQGDKQALELNDLPLKEYQFDDLSFFTKKFEPQKQLLSLLENPDVIMQLDNKELALDFDEK